MTPRALSITVALVSALFSAGGHASPTLDEWVAVHVDPSEKTVCTRQAGSELFFVALAANERVRLGDRLDMSGYSETHSFSVAWTITDERGRSLVAKTPPVSITQRYVKEGSKVYADGVGYQTLNSGDANILRFEVAIEKCSVRSDTSGSCKSGEKRYTVKVCEVRL